MLPVIAHNLLQSIELLGERLQWSWPTRQSPALRSITSIIAELVDRNPIMVTALNPIIGYDLAAKIAKRAYAENRRVKDVAAEMTDLSPPNSIGCLTRPTCRWRNQGRTVGGG